MTPAEKYLKDKPCDRVRGEEPYHIEMYYKESVTKLMTDFAEQENKTKTIDKVDNFNLTKKLKEVEQENKELREEIEEYWKPNIKKLAIEIKHLKE